MLASFAASLLLACPLCAQAPDNVSAAPPHAAQTAKSPAHRHHVAKPKASQNLRNKVRAVGPEHARPVTIGPAPSQNLSNKVKAVGPEAAPPLPPTPRLPVNQPPAPADISWNSQGLEVRASNSSLQQILNQVGTVTGAKIQGADHDERIFGIYGPGPARDVLSQLLHGTGYNVLMLGDQGSGTPREIVLSARSSAPTAMPGQPMPSQQPQEDEDEGNGDEPQPQPGPFFNRPPLSMPPQRPPITPQERMQQMQQMEQERQRQLQQQPPR